MKKPSTPRSGSFAQDADDTESMLRRLRRVEGQVRGVQGMMEDNRYCVDVLTQLSAAQEGLRAVSHQVIRGHLRHCMKGACAAKDGGADAIIEELLAVLKKHR